MLRRLLPALIVFCAVLAVPPAASADDLSGKQALRLAKPSGTVVEEVVHPAGRAPSVPEGLVARELAAPMVRGGDAVADFSLEAARARVAAGLVSLPWDGLKLSGGEPAIPTRMVAPEGT